MSLSSVFWIVGVFFVVVIVAVIVSNFARDQEIKHSANNLIARATQKFPNFAGKYAILGETMVLIVDEDKEMTLVATSDGIAKEIPFSKFEKIEILEDGYSVAETRRKGAIQRAAVGGALTGGAGAVVGALTAGSVTNHREIVTNITIAVTTSDASFPRMAWCTFAPKFGVEHMNALEVSIQRKNARNFAEQFSPIFAPNRDTDEELVQI